MKHGSIITVILILSLLTSIASACTKEPVEPGAATDYLAVAPGTLHLGENTAVTFTLLDNNGQFAKDNVQVSLRKGDETVASGSGWIDGKGQVQLNVPKDLQEGDYELYVKSTNFQDKASVKVKRSLLTFLETDKPIYKPGQTIHIRLVTLNSDLLPIEETATVEVLDAKGIKIFRKEVTTDEYGMATVDLPLSSEPNLGQWKINAKAEGETTQLDVKVEEYVLPKYEVGVDLAKEWCLVNESIKGSVKAEYSFGKPVKGELHITASRCVGEWEEYTTLTKPIDGETDFEISPVEYVAGVPEAQGMGNVMLDITVTEESTGYQEKTTKMLTVSESSVNIQAIPESSVFKPGLPFNFLIVTETPDNQPTESAVQVGIHYFNEDFERIKTEETSIKTTKGQGILSVMPPDDAVALEVHASANGAETTKSVEAGYSPSDNFIHVEQVSEGIPQVGQNIKFKVHSTQEAANFYYEVVSRDKVVFTDFSDNNEISFTTSPQMAPSAKLLVYQILPNSEVAADYIPFSVDADYPNKLEASFSRDEASPAEEVDMQISSEGQSKIGIAAVDKSVFMLAENRLNLQQVFAELERLYMEPQVELHEASIYCGITARGARETFGDAGVVVMSNQSVPEGKEYGREMGIRDAGGLLLEGKGAVPEAANAVPGPQGPSGDAGGLAEVERVRQFFPETWLWQEIVTDANGNASLDVTVPDTITTWMLHAIGISKENGLGIDEARLKAFQPFFLKVDLPYSSIRGEEFPVSVAIYNYLDRTQRVRVSIEEAERFDLLSADEKWVEVPANGIGGAEFTISPQELGTSKIEITAQSEEAADAVKKDVLVEPEGVARETIDNLTLSGGTSKTVNTDIPAKSVEGSGRAYVAVTSSFLTQTIEGLEGLLKMPFGCGEQNMMMFAPNAYITRYLKQTEQIKPEIMAKAEKLMITGYQRELTYRRSDGSFSAFGQSDKEGSLFLTAFVLKCFSQAENLIYIDENVLDEAEEWIKSHQNSDGSFDPVGFVHHQELMGGVQGKTALTAYATIALLEAGETSASANAVEYLENQLDGIDDAYTAAITAYALELAGSGLTDKAHKKLMDFATEDENGLYWGTEIEEITPRPGTSRSASIEATGYATLALIEHGDAFNASRAAKWLVSQRNAYGGYGSTQDTVIALEALTRYSAGAQADVDLTVNISAGSEEKELRITPENFDVLQTVEVSVDSNVTIEVAGKGEAIAQVVKRFNMPEVTRTGEEAFSINVDYDTTEVEVNDLVEVSAEIEFTPPEPMKAEMVVLDISVPTGFEPVVETIEEVVKANEKIKRYDIAGRKVIFYIEDMADGERISFKFDVQARYPVKAKGVSSEVYSYYNRAMSGETLGQDVTVAE